MHHIRNPFSLATAAVVIFLFERGAEAAWPETPAWTWWSLAVVGAVIWVVATYLERHRKAVAQESAENRPDSPHRGDRHGLVPHAGRIGTAPCGRQEGLPGSHPSYVQRNRQGGAALWSPAAIAVPSPHPTHMSTNSERMAAPSTCSTKTTGWLTCMFTVPM